MAHHERRRAALAERLAQRVRDRGVEALQVGPARGGLERLHHHAAVEQLVAQVGARDSGRAATPRPAGGRAQRRRRPRSSPAVCRRRRSTSSSSPSNPRIGDAAALVAAQAQIARAQPLRPAPGGRHRERQPRLVPRRRGAPRRGDAAACSITRKRVAALRERARTTNPRSGAKAGAGRTRSVASQITPSTPSEPTSSSRSVRPGGRRRHGPRSDLTDRRRRSAAASTSSSIRP